MSTIQTRDLKKKQEKEFNSYHHLLVSYQFSCTNIVMSRYNGPIIIYSYVDTYLREPFAIFRYLMSSDE